MCMQKDFSTPLKMGVISSHNSPAYLNERKKSLPC